MFNLPIFVEGILMPLLGLGVFVVYKRSKRKKRKFHSPPTNQQPIWWEEKGLNVTQGMALLLLKPLNLPANLVLKLIIFITDPKNDIGY